MEGDEPQTKKQPAAVVTVTAHQLTNVTSVEPAASNNNQTNPDEEDCHRTSEGSHNLPKINCPEKIVLCFDLSSELNSVMLRQNQEKSVIQMVKRAMGFFVKHKLGINKKHKFAILTFDRDALWVQDFSSDALLISDTLDNIHPNATDPLQQIDMTSLFETIEEHVELPEEENVDIPPEYVVRILMIYGRSHSDLPNFSPKGKKIFHKFMSCPFFFFDVLYIHELPHDDDNKCEEIYDAFCKLDEKEECFMLEVSHIPARLFEHTAKLLAHPLQRPKQQDIEYRIVRNDDTDEELEPE